jgi:hypothetical protein
VALAAALATPPAQGPTPDPPPRAPLCPEQGAAVLVDQSEKIARAVASARPLRLGGARAQPSWGLALGCVVSGEMVGWRSTLGNKLAQASKEAGLKPVGVVAYVEVRRAPGAGSRPSRLPARLPRPQKRLGTSCSLLSRPVSPTPIASP